MPIEKLDITARPGPGSTSRYYEVWWLKSDGTEELVDRHQSDDEAWQTYINFMLAHRDELTVVQIRRPVAEVKAYGILSPDQGPDTQPPSTPQNVTGQPLNAVSIRLDWDPSTDNVGVTAYQVWRDGVPINENVPAPPFDDTGLSPSTSYSYQVAASDGAGNQSAFSSPVSVTTNPNAVPVWTIGDQGLTQGQAYSLDLDTVCSDADGDPITYTVEAGTLPAGVALSGSVISGTPTTVETQAVTLGASDGIGPIQTVVVTFDVVAEDTTPPAAPTGLTVTGVDSSSITIDWADNAEPDLASYSVYRSTDGLSFGLRQAGLTTSNYQDTGLSAGTQYWYYPTAIDDSGNESSAPAAVSATTAASGQSNAARVSSSMNGRAPSFPYNIPADPVTTQTINIAPGDSAALAAAVQTAGALINVPAGTYTTDLNFYANDVDLVMDNGATVVGNITFGFGPSGASGRNRRVRWTGGNQSGGTLTLNHFDDLMIDDVYFTTAAGLNQMSGGSNGSDDGWRRICFRRTTIDDLSTNGSGDWAFYCEGYSAGVYEDLLLLSVKFLTDGSQNNRFQGMTRFVCVDSTFNEDFNSNNGLRTGWNAASEYVTDLYFDNVIFNELYLITNTTNATFNRVHRYHLGSFFNFGDHSGTNSGVVSNSAAYGTTGTPPGTIAGIAPLTDAGNNTTGLHGGGTPTTMPDGGAVALIGAQR